MLTWYHGGGILKNVFWGWVPMLAPAKDRRSREVAEMEVVANVRAHRHGVVLPKS